MFKKTLFATTLVALTGSVSAIDLEINAGALEFGLGNSSGIDLAQNSVLKLGFFAVDPLSSNFAQLSDSLIVANQNDYAYLASHFVQFGVDFFSGQILGSDDPDYASSQFFVSQTGAPTNFSGKNIFLWAFNRTTPVPGNFGPGDEIGIFKSPGVFPSGADEFSNVAGISLEPAEFGVAGSPAILVGGFGVGTVDPAGSSAGGAPLYNTEAVPEPSAILAIVSGAVVLCGLRRRRNA
jgi:hypothetical protein